MKTKQIGAGIALGILLISCGTSKEEREKEQRSISACMAPPADMAMTYETQNTEEYSNVKESGYRSVFQNPYSTFSIDVDAASYSNMRRMLLQGILPPPEAVRIEEWINYFNYRYEQPEPGKPFSINTELSDCPWNKKHQLLQIGLKGEEIKLDEASPNNLVFLIDVSGSMNAPNKLPLLKRAFELMLPQLKKKDRVSLVVYAGAAGVIIEGIKGTEKEEIKEALEKLEAGGSTAGGEGIELAYHIAKDNFMEDGNNRVILATDGDFNVGLSSESELENLIEEKRKSGIYLSVLGFGSGNIKDNKMELLADKGNGNYYYIDNFLEARKVLVQQFGGTIHTIAKDVKIQVEFNPAYVKEYRLVGYDNRLLNAEDFNDDKKDAGELGSGHKVTALYEIVLAESDESNVKTDDLKYQQKHTGQKNNELANIKFRYKHPAKNDTSSKLIQQSVTANIKPWNNVSENLKLASAVTEFGLLVKNSEFKGEANFENAIARASELRSGDSEGYVEELIRLMKIAKDLKPAAAN